MNWKQVQKELERYDAKDSKELDIIKTINKDCSIFLSSIDYGQKCFRGTKNDIQSIEKMVPRKNRIPKDTPESLHKALDKEFKKQFGWNVRSEAVFCAPNVYIAEEYGKANYFFPIGNFEMVWSDIHQDLYVTLRDAGLVSAYGTALKYHADEVTPDDIKNWEKEIKDIVREYGDMTNGAKAALYDNSEIMCKCKSYYMVNTNFVTRHFNAVFAQTKGAPKWLS